MTFEEKLAAARAAKQGGELSFEEKLAAARAKQQSQAPEEEYESSWYDPVREVLGGMTGEFADEAGAGIATALVAATDGKDTDWGEVYSDIKGNLEKERRDYQENNPVLSTSLNVAGAIPTAVASGGVNALARAPQALQRAPRMLRRAAEGAQRASQALDATGKGRLLKTALKGAGAGALYGAGAAEQGDTVEGAVTGGTVGTVLPLAAAGLGKAGGSAIKKRVEESLTDSQGNFRPLNYVAPEGSRIQGLYQKYFGNAFGGKQLRDDSRKVLERAELDAEDAAKFVTDEKVVNSAVRNTRLRSQLRASAVPENASDEVKEAILRADGQQAVRLLNDAWEDGFDMVKGETFDINPKQISQELVKRLNSSADSEAKGKVVSALNKLFSDTFKQGTKTVRDPQTLSLRSQVTDAGKIASDDLMQIRNNLSMQGRKLINGSDSAQRLDGYALLQAKELIDELIEDSLPPDKAVAFSKALTAYGNKDTLEKATQKAVVTNQGLATPNNILSAGSGQSRRRAGEGAARGQQAAQQTQRENSRALTKAMQARDEAKKNLADVKERTPTLKPTAFQQGSTTGVMATPFTTVLGATAVPATIAATRVMSTRTAQRIIAGQSVTQEALRKLVSQMQEAGIPDATIKTMVASASSSASEGVSQDE